MDSFVLPGSEDDLGPRTLGIAIATFVLAAVSFVCRLVARRRERSRFWWDDALAGLGLLGCIAILVSIIIAKNEGLGRHYLVVGIPALGDFLKLLYVMELVYVVTLGFLKYSLLAYYFRTIESRRIRIPIYVTAAIVTGWMVSAAFVSIFQCSPVVAAWDLLLRISGTASCIDIKQFYLATAIPNIITDFFLILLPIPFLLHTTASAVQKGIQCAIFALGIFVAITSGLRLRVLAQLDGDPLDVTWTFADPIIFSVVETTIGLVVINLPVMVHGFSHPRSEPEVQTEVRKKVPTDAS